MSVVNIKALIECDECGERFRVDLDPAYELPSGWTLFDAAEDEVRGGVSHDQGEQYSTSVQDGKMLCPDCTQKLDTREEK